MFPSVITFTSGAGDNVGILLFCLSSCESTVLDSTAAVPLSTRLPPSLLLSSVLLLDWSLEKSRGLLGDVRVMLRLKFGSAPQEASGFGTVENPSSSGNEPSTWTACFLRFRMPEADAMVIRSPCLTKIRNHLVCKFILMPRPQRRQCRLTDGCNTDSATHMHQWKFGIRKVPKPDAQNHRSTAERIDSTVKLDDPDKQNAPDVSAA